MVSIKYTQIHIILLFSAIIIGFLTHLMAKMPIYNVLIANILEKYSQNYSRADTFLRLDSYL